MTALPLPGEPGAPPDEAAHQARQEQRLRRSMTVFYVCLGYTILATVLWLYLMVTQADGGVFFGNYRVDGKQIANTVGGIVFMWMIWSYAFHWLKWGLLKRAGLNRDELRLVFGNRLKGFDLEVILQRHSERTLRIIDMIGRRSRTIIFVLLGFGVVYFQLRQKPSREAFAFGLQSSLFDAMVMSWWTVLTFHANGVFGHMSYGAHARVLDGIQGRANALCIGTLWNLFKFVMVPIGVRLADIYPPSTYAVVYAFIWLSYAAADFASEIFGSLFGKHGIRVWGLGDMNRKSWAGVVAAFIAALAVNLAVVAANGLGLQWYILALIISLVNPFVELYSPRGTDDFTMATTNALVCWAYGALVFAR
jgi:hypothetical protein